MPHIEAGNEPALRALKEGKMMTARGGIYGDYYGDGTMVYSDRHRDRWTRHQTGEDWRLGRASTGWTDRYRWVFPDRPDNRTKEEWPYSYSDHYLWGQNSEGDHAVYSDRLSQWSAEQWNRAWDFLKRDGRQKRFDQFSREDASLFLTHYYGWPTICTALSEGCNISNGYPYWVFYFRSGF